MLNIKIRVDDFPQGQPHERYNEQSKQLLAHLESRKEPYMLAVVPFLINKVDRDYLNTLEYARICMHGFDHAVTHWRPASEFQSMPINDIFNNMCNAYEIFEGIKNKIPVFIPPFNMFNQDLLDVLDDYGFEYITGGPETFTQMDITKLNFHRVDLITSQGKFYTSNGNLKTILSYIPELLDSQHVTLHLCGNYEI